MITRSGIHSPSESIDKKISAAVKRNVTKSERRAQRISAIMSGLKDYPTGEKERKSLRKEIQKELDKHIG